MTEVLEKTWRQQAKELGIKMYRRTKVDVLAEIAAKESLEQPSQLEVIDVSGTAETLLPGTVIYTDEIAPVPEHPLWENDGRRTEVEPLMRRIEALENRVNSIVEALSKSKKVKGL